MGGSRFLFGALIVTLALTTADAQTTKRRATTKKTPAPVASTMTRVQATVQCQSELGVGITTERRYCDVLTGRDPQNGILIDVPPHRGPVTLSFDLHNRHTYSEELIKQRKAFRQYTASIGVFYMDNTLIERAVILSEFRGPDDLVDRIEGGAGPGGVKAVAPTGTEFVSITLPDDVGERVSILGEKLRVSRPDGTDNFSAEGRPIATISNVMIEYRPAPAPRKADRKR